MAAVAPFLPAFAFQGQDENRQMPASPPHKPSRPGSSPQQRQPLHAMHAPQFGQYPVYQPQYYVPPPYYYAPQQRPRTHSSPASASPYFAAPVYGPPIQYYSPQMHAAPFHYPGQPADTDMHRHPHSPSRIRTDSQRSHSPASSVARSRTDSDIARHDRPRADSSTSSLNSPRASPRSASPAVTAERARSTTPTQSSPDGGRTTPTQNYAHSRSSSTSSLNVPPPVIVRKPSPLAQESDVYRSPTRSSPVKTPSRPFTPIDTFKKHGKLSGKLRKAFSLNNMNNVAASNEATKANAGRESLTSTSSSDTSNGPNTPPNGTDFSPAFNSPNPSLEFTNGPGSSNSLPSSSGKRAGLLSSRMNTSTDNLSISSTVSSASMMLRKIGNVGRLARRHSLMSISSIFRDKDKQQLSDKDEEAPSTKLKKNSKASPSTARVSHVVAHNEEGPSSHITPAAALVRQHQEQSSESATDRQPPAQISTKAKKGKKWGFKSASAASSANASPEPSNEQHSQEEDRLLEDNVEDWDGQPASYFDDDTITYHQPPVQPSEDYDTDVPPRPPRTAQPAKGILKNALSYSQEAILPPEKPFARVRSASYDAPAQGAHPAASPTPSHGTALVDAIPSEDQVDGLVSASTSPRHDHRPPSPNLSTSPYSNPSLNASAPVLNSPFARVAMRSATSPQATGRRIAFAQSLSIHTTWPGTVYDRRGEPATCNRLTAVLAQQIKEELNAYKMEEMQVHHKSRGYTHFFV